MGKQKQLTVKYNSKMKFLVYGGLDWQVKTLKSGSFISLE
jgi:hypothetical protein